MSLHDFMRAQRQRLDDFETWWMAQHHKDPKAFPLTAEPGRFDDQARLFRPSPNSV